MLAVGSWEPDNLHTELYDFNASTWNLASDYPWIEYGSISHAPVLFLFDAFFVIGGWNGQNPTNKIGQFTPSTGLWTGRIRNKNRCHRNKLFLI